MRAISYERVSTDEQVTNYSLEAQNDANLNLIKARGWTFVRAYRDEGVSAQTTDRPDFQRMLADAKAGQYDVIVVHKLDRFSRSLTDMILTMRDLEQLGVTVISTTEQFDFTTPIGRVLLALLAAFAQWYIDNLRLETQKGKKARALAGGWSNRLAFGYYARYKKHGGDGLAVPDEHARNGVQLMFNLYETGFHSFAGVADELHTNGYRPTGRAGKKHSLPRWTRDAVAFALQNRFYIGEVMYQGKWYPGAHEPIISREQFDRVQAIMKARRKVPGFTAKQSERVYLLSGLVRCATCGSKMRGTYRSYKEVDTLYYRCSAALKGIPCGMGFVPAQQAESTVAHYLQRINLPHNWREQALDQIRTEQEQSVPATEPRVSESGLKAKLIRLTELYEEGDISKERYRVRKAEIEQQMDTLIAHKAGYGSAFRVEAAIEVLASMSNTWEAATPKERRELMKSLISEVILSDEGGIIIQPRPEVAPLFDLARIPVESFILSA